MLIYQRVYATIKLSIRLHMCGMSVCGRCSTSMRHVKPESRKAVGTWMGRVGSWNPQASLFGNVTCWPSLYLIIICVYFNVYYMILYDTIWYYMILYIYTIYIYMCISKNVCAPADKFMSISAEHEINCPGHALSSFEWTHGTYVYAQDNIYIYVYIYINYVCFFVRTCVLCVYLVCWSTHSLEKHWHCKNIKDLKFT